MTNTLRILFALTFALVLAACGDTPSADASSQASAAPNADITQAAADAAATAADAEAEAAETGNTADANTTDADAAEPASEENNG